jgi:hypothetical protein
MKTNIIKIGILCMAVLFSSCFEKEKQVQEQLVEGTYKGTFKVTYPTGTETGETTLEIIDGKFVCSGNTNRIPAGGSGNYSLGNGKITFNDQNFWTADFNWNLILSGAYDYSFDGKTLKFKAEKNGTGVYEYELKKQ